MSASAAIIGKGTTLSVSASVASGYTALSEVFSVGVPDTDVDDVEVTHYTSDDNFKEFIAGWESGNEVEFEQNYLKATVTTLTAIRRLTRYWKITLPDSSIWVFPGYLKKIGGSNPNQDKVTIKGTIKLTGKPNFTASTT